MKILIDGWYLKGMDQGVKTYTIKILESLEALAPSNYEISVICPKRTSLDSLKGVGNIDVISLGWYGRFFRFFLLGIYAKFKGFDVLHTQYFTPLIKPKGLDVVCSIHDVLVCSHPIFFSKYYRFSRYILFWWSSYISKKVITISAQSADEIKKYLPVKTTDLYFAELGVDIPRPNDHSLLETTMSDLYILAVGRHELRKNYNLLTDAYLKSNLRNRGYTLVICGHMPADIAGKLPRDKSIRYVQGLSDNELQGLYHNCSLFVFPSLAEGYGLPVIEALVHGVPVASSSTLPIPSILNRCLYTFDPNNIDELIDIFNQTNAKDSNEQTAKLRDFSFPKWSGHVTEIIRAIESI